MIETLTKRRRGEPSGSKRGYFMVGVWHIKSHVNLGTLFRSATCFGAAGIFTVGRRYKPQSSDTTACHRHMPCFHYDDIESLVAGLPYDCPLIGVELDEQAVNLSSFSHPERACYLLGAEDHGLSQEIREACHGLIVIPGASRCLNVAVAGSIVLYDRTQKRDPAL